MFVIGRKNREALTLTMEEESTEILFIKAPEKNKRKSFYIWCTDKQFKAFHVILTEIISIKKTFLKVS